MSSLFRLFRIKGAIVSEDKSFERAAVSLYRHRTHCSPSAANPNVWGFGWDAQGGKIFLLIQPTANESCGRPDDFISLVVRTSDGRIRWMDVRAYLQREHDAGREVKQIVFDGEPFTAYTVRTMRDKALAGS